MGCGAGGQSVRMAQAGASVLGVDVLDFSDAFSALRTEHTLSTTQLRFERHDMRDLLHIINDRQIDVCLLQRVMHYVRYEEALFLLQALKNTGVQRVYISVTGLESDIGKSYIDADKRVQERFCTLTEKHSQTFHITEPVCLYTPEEFMMLLHTSGWGIQEYWVSAFGNIKAVCS